jgi:hypothetical protein
MGEASTMKCEYLIVKVHKDLEKREFAFNVLIDEDWELVAVDNKTAYFKRPLLPTPKEMAREDAVRIVTDLSKRDDATSKSAANFIRNTIGIANTILNSGWEFEKGHDLINDILYPAFRDRTNE